MAIREESSAIPDWPQWQQGVVRLLRAELQGVVENIGTDNVDWAAWQTLYMQGRTPRSAVDRALERDL